MISKPGDIERKTQDRVVRLFTKELGYSYYGNWEERENNSCIDEVYLKKYLTRQGYTEAQINKAIYELKAVASDFSDGLYATNKKVYEKLRYGVNVKTAVGEKMETIKLFDWENFSANNFAIAEEVSITGNKTKRPDLVLYVNGIALVVIELKRAIVDISKGIRQNITNQQDRFIQPFFATIQLVMAGNDSQGLRYGTTNTPEKWFLSWKEDVEDNSRLKLDKYLLKMCAKGRLMELIYDFILFDGGVKKIPRVHQYFGIKAAQGFVNQKEGGIIWHTQGSGKSISMVLLAKWILENKPHARVAILTDRTELDKQIEGVFTDAGETIYRTKSGKELRYYLGDHQKRLICSLIHKFGKKDVKNFKQFIKELEDNPIPVAGDLFVFVDECHRTQSGKLHKTMKAMLPDAVFIGFTGTPLLKKDKQSSMEVFGQYIHTYKFNEGVEDGIVLDLIYEARDIDQRLSSEDKIDEWFESKTRGLNEFQQSELKKKWGTMQRVLSSRSRMSKIVMDIVHDFSTRPRLASQSGNAILVAHSIYEACEYYKQFQLTELRNKCAVVTSYNPQTKDITTEDTGANTDTQKEAIYHLYESILKDVKADPNKSKTETYEDWAKLKFKKEPANMKLLIVVSKLLTGFDAPSCSYLYIDKNMQDHGLFQAICRVNRLDTDDKQFGYIVDYRDLFNKVGEAISVYTSELDNEHFEQKDIDILLKDRLKTAKERLDNALEEISLLCEAVKPPKGTLEYIRYFCGNTEIPEDLKATETQRMTLYKKTVALIRAYANIANEMEEAGYTEREIVSIKKELDFYLNLREEIRNASDEKLDFKTYEADMRHLIDTYIQADESRKISQFGDLSLLEIIVKAGIGEAIEDLPNGIKSSPEAIAETIENNVRKKIIKEHLIDPAYFENMSKLLEAIVRERRANAITYEEYLQKIGDLAKRVQEGKGEETPKSLNTYGKRALYNNLGQNEALALKIDERIKAERPADWRENSVKENMIRNNIYKILTEEDLKATNHQPDIKEEVEKIFLILKKNTEY